MDELVKQLGFRVVPKGEGYQIQYVDRNKEGKEIVSRVAPCLFPEVWILWQLAVSHYQAQAVNKAQE